MENGYVSFVAKSNILSIKEGTLLKGDGKKYTQSESEAILKIVNGGKAA